MAATNGALALGGMRKRSVCQGASSFFFQHLAHGLVADVLDVAELDHAVGQQTQGPARRAGRRLAARERDQVRFGAPVEHHPATRVVHGPVAHGSKRPLERGALAYPRDRGQADAERLGDFGVGLTVVDA